MCKPVAKWLDSKQNSWSEQKPTWIYHVRTFWKWKVSAWRWFCIKIIYNFVSKCSEIDGTDAKEEPGEEIAVDGSATVNQNEGNVEDSAKVEERKATAKESKKDKKKEKGGGASGKDAKKPPAKGQGSQFQSISMLNTYWGSWNWGIRNHRFKIEGIGKQLLGCIHVSRIMNETLSESRDISCP